MGPFAFCRPPVTVFRVEVALRHLGHVVLVQELAAVALLAEPPQPVLADHGLVAADVAKGAGRSVGTRGPDVELAHRSARLVHPRKGQRPDAPLQKGTASFTDLTRESRLALTWVAREISMSNSMWCTGATSMSILNRDE